MVMFIKTILIPMCFTMSHWIHNLEWITMCLIILWYSTIWFIWFICFGGWGVLITSVREVAKHHNAWQNTMFKVKIDVSCLPLYANHGSPCFKMLDLCRCKPKTWMHTSFFHLKGGCVCRWWLLWIRSSISTSEIYFFFFFFALPLVLILSARKLFIVGVNTLSFAHVWKPSFDVYTSHNCSTCLNSNSYVLPTLWWIFLHFIQTCWTLEFWQKKIQRLKTKGCFQIKKIYVLQ